MKKPILLSCFLVLIICVVIIISAIIGLKRAVWSDDKDEMMAEFSRLNYSVCYFRLECGSNMDRVQIWPAVLYLRFTRGEFHENETCYGRGYDRLYLAWKK
jgi:hypothetical protein